MARLDEDRHAEISEMLCLRIINGDRIVMLPEALANARQQHDPKMSQRDLAEAATKAGGRVSEGLIALIETGRRQPSEDNAKAIAEALGVDLRSLAIITDRAAIRRMLSEVAA